MIRIFSSRVWTKLEALPRGLSTYVGYNNCESNIVCKTCNVTTKTTLPPLQIWPELCQIQTRGYAKGRDKKGDKKQSRANITDEELAEIINLDNYKRSLEEALEDLKNDYVVNLAVRTSAGSLESISVELEGDTYPLSEIAQVIRKSPTSVMINASAFPQAASNIKKALEESGMNLNPQQEGTTFYVPIPKVTKEHREGLAQNAKMLYEKTKVQFRDIQNKFIKKLKAKEGAVSADMLFNAKAKILEMAHDKTKEAETLMKNKQNELLKK